MPNDIVGRALYSENTKLNARLALRQRADLLVAREDEGSGQYFDK